MSKINLGEEFIATTEDAVSTKRYISDQAKLRYIMRAIIPSIFIAFGYILYFQFLVLYEPYGAYHIGKTLGMMFFGFVLVYIYYTKSELLTSNMMMVSVAKYNKKINFSTMFKIMGLCLLGNFIGAIIIGALISVTSLINSDVIYYMNESLQIKQGYIIDKEILDLFLRAVFCNFFISMSILLCNSGNIKSDVAKILVLFYAVFIFFFLGLEHSIASLVLFSLGFFVDLIHGTDMVNLVVATKYMVVCLLGNFVGGGICVGIYYAYLNGSKKDNLQESND